MLECVFKLGFVKFSGLFWPLSIKALGLYQRDMTPKALIEKRLKRTEKLTAFYGIYR